MMNRRGFFGLLGAVAAGAALDPERLLWVPGKKLISIPRPVLPWQRVHAQFEIGQAWRGLAPAFAAIENLIRERYRVASFERLELPKGVNFAGYYATRSNMPVRVIVAYDFNRDDPQLLGIVDCAFRGERKT